jgi:hypothetical protein
MFYSVYILTRSESADVRRTITALKFYLILFLILIRIIGSSCELSYTATQIVNGLPKVEMKLSPIPPA